MLLKTKARLTVKEAEARNACCALGRMRSNTETSSMTLEERPSQKAMDACDGFEDTNTTIIPPSIVARPARSEFHKASLLAPPLLLAPPSLFAPFTLAPPVRELEGRVI